MKTLAAWMLVPMLASAAFVAAVSGMQQAAQQQPLPTFKARIDVVVVDVSILDDSGRPLADLRPEEFRVTVEGKPRKVTSLDFISHLSTTSTVTPAPAPQAAPPRRFSSNVVTSERPAGRNVLIVVDHEHIRAGAGRKELDSLSRFLDRLGPTDRVGLAVVPNGRGSVEFTTDRAVLRAALSTVVGHYHPMFTPRDVGLHEAYAFMAGGAGDAREVWAEAIDRACGPPPRPPDCVADMATTARRLHQETEASSRASVAALKALINASAAIPGPKTFILLSEGLPLGPYLGTSLDVRSELRELAGTASRAQVTIHVLQMDVPLADASTKGSPPTASQDSDIRATGLEDVAGATGGTRYFVSGVPDKPLERVALETSGYYLLGFLSEESDRDGKLHKIKVDVTRPRVTVRARSSFSFDASAITASGSPEQIVAAMLKSPAPVAELPLEVATYTIRDPDSADRMRIVITADVDRGAKGPSRCSIGFVLFDEKGKVVGNSFEVVELAPASGQEGGSLGWTGAAIVPPGRYTLRFGVLDSSGRRGSVEHPVEARVTAGKGVEIGDLFIVERSAGDAKAVRPSITARARGTMAAYVEVYSADAERLKRTTAALEIAQHADGPPLTSTPMEVEVKGIARLAGSGIIPVGLLPSGDYVARAVVSLDGAPLGRVSRSIRVDASPGEAVGNSAAPLAARAVLQPFRREDALQKDVVGHFLDRLNEVWRPAPSSALARAAVHARQGQFEAIGETLGSVGSDNPAALFLRGLALFARNDLANAEADFQAALELSPDLGPAGFYLGASQAAAGRPAEAVDTWRSAFARGSSSPVVYRFLADVLLAAEAGGLAQKMLVEGVALLPEDGDLTRRLAIAYAIGGSAAQALDTLDPYVAKHPDDHAAVFLALACLFDAHVRGTTLLRGDGDRTRAAQYAALYEKSSGDRQALVALWAKSISGGTREPR